MSRALLERATAYADSVLAELTTDDLRLATPCDGWDVGRVVLHLADVADGLVNLLETGQLALPDQERTDDPEPVCVLRACLNRLDARLSTASDPERVAAAAEAGAIELTMHGWDIGIARDPDHATPPALAREILERASARVTDELRDPIFGPPVPTPAGAVPGERLAAFLGRRSPDRTLPPARADDARAREGLVPAGVVDVAADQRPEEHDLLPVHAVRADP